MDPLSQGLLGAALPQSFAKRIHLRYAALCGAIGGMAPDLDVFIRSDDDPLLRIEYHRHFTHALAFAPIGGLLVALFMWLVPFRRKQPFWLIYLFTTLGYATHGFLDACTSYGTRLYWPFSDFRVGWNIISIIDPVFTFTLLIFCLLSLIRKSTMLMRVGLVLALSYLGFGLYKHHLVEEYVYALAEKRGHTVDRVLLNPTIGNNILWRTVYQSGDHYYTDAVHLSLIAPPVLHEGMQVPVIDKDTIFPELPDDSTQRNDIRRFAYFSQDYLYIHPDSPYILSDLRYGTLPYDNLSLWGIRVNPAKPEEHVEFVSLRDFSDRHYEQFWLMLWGE